MTRRSDHETAATVSRGIFLASYFGTDAGAAFMSNWQVPFDVAHRVLTRPDQRRAMRPIREYVVAVEVPL